MCALTVEQDAITFSNKLWRNVLPNDGRNGEAVNQDHLEERFREGSMRDV